jgi:hypothetical protein
MRTQLGHARRANQVQRWRDQTTFGGRTNRPWTAAPKIKFESIFKANDAFRAARKNIVVSF